MQLHAGVSQLTLPWGFWEARLSKLLPLCEEPAGSPEAAELSRDRAEPEAVSQRLEAAAPAGSCHIQGPKDGNFDIKMSRLDYLYMKEVIDAK